MLFVGCVLYMVVAVSHAATPTVERHDLQCGDVFPCPEEIQRRVDFWGSGVSPVGYRTASDS